MGLEAQPTIGRAINKSSPKSKVQCRQSAFMVSSYSFIDNSPATAVGGADFIRRPDRIRVPAPAVSAGSTGPREK